MRQAIAYRLFSKYGITISPQKLLSVYSNYILDDTIEDLIDAERPWFNFLESKLDLQDEIRGATAIFKYMETYFESNGVWTYKTIRINKEDTVVRDRYFTNNPNLIVEIISDHLGLLPAEGQLDQRETIGRFSSDYSLRFRDKYKACVIHIQQQALMGSQQQFTSSGKSIIEKLKPDISNLANNKEVSRDVNLCIGLFAPNKYGFDSYKDYDLSRLKDNHRELIIMLNRDGISSASIDLYFQGAAGYFSELSRPEDMAESNYIEIEKIRSRTI